MWVEENNQLKKSFKFTDFIQAFAFMTQVAEAAEAMNHHPAWSNVYNVVNFKLYTFDAGNTVTTRDRQLAESIDKIAATYGARELSPK